jgi:indolepyruvate decarboxylase
MDRTDFTVAKYLITRLEELGLKHCFGVPGDYTLDFLDVLCKSKIKWVGTCNELNAGYAADAYARYTGLGAACVTYGVGGLSIINAVAGAFSEQAPMVMISGAPHSARRKSNALVHHLIADYRLQYDVFRKVTVDAAMLTNPNTAPEEIDRVLSNCLTYKKPVYIELPMDLVYMPCPAPKPYEFIQKQISNKGALEACIMEVASMINAAKSPLIIAGVELLRHNLSRKALKLVETAELPFATTVSSKSSLPELHPQFIGLYQGGMSRDYVKDQIESSDCVLSLGVWMTDFETGGFTTHIDDSSIISCNFDTVQIRHHYYNQVMLADLLDGLVQKVEPRSFLQSRPVKPYFQKRKFEAIADKPLTTRRFYEKINSILTDDMILIAETGDIVCTAPDLQIEEAENFLAQPYYMSIGYATPATLGVTLARPNKRPVLLTGDGAFQMTAQELSSLLRIGSNAIIFLLNNEGYTIERILHDDNIYNDLQNWRYSKLPDALGGDALALEVSTEEQLESAVNSALAAKDKLVFIELHLEKMDASDALKHFAESLKRLARDKA